jgi:uncharacterized circularly permuted ATP-grasp superfamily protein
VRERTAAVPDGAAAALAAAVAEQQVLHPDKGEARPLRVDPLPRVVAGEEWDALAAGLAQRTRALEAFLRDPAVAVEAGVVPVDLVSSSIHAAPEQPPPLVPLGVHGPDLARDADGTWRVLEDNCRTPTLQGYATVLRELLAPLVDLPAGLRPFGEPLVPALLRVLHAATEVADPVVAVLVDDAGVTWEPREIARRAGLPVVTVGELRHRDSRVVLPDGRPVDVLWRRTSEERLQDDAGRDNALGLALREPLRRGTVRVVNPFGTGLADDKRVLRAVEDLVRLHLGEEPLLRTARSYDLGRPDDLAAVEHRLGELVLKPRAGSGGYGIVVGPEAGPAARDAAVAAALRDPAGWTAQEVVALSTCALADGTERHVDLRPCVLSDGATVTVLPGGLTRWAAEPHRLVVNCSQGGGGKDTWVVDGLGDP